MSEEKDMSEQWYDFEPITNVNDFPIKPTLSNEAQEKFIKESQIHKASDFESRLITHYEYGLKSGYAQAKRDVSYLSFPVRLWKAITNTF